MPAVLTSAACHRACCAAPNRCRAPLQICCCSSPGPQRSPAPRSTSIAAPEQPELHQCSAPGLAPCWPQNSVPSSSDASSTFTCLTSSLVHRKPRPTCPFPSPAPPLHELHSTADGGRAKQHPNDRGNHAAGRGCCRALRMLRGPTTRPVRGVPAHAAHFRCACPYRSMLMA